jgi:hypothetical protein
VGLPVLLEHLAHGVDDLDAVVDGRVVAGGDHDANSLAAEAAASEGGEQADAEGDAVEEIGVHAEAGGAILVRLARHDRVLGRGREDLVIHGCED